MSNIKNSLRKRLNNLLIELDLLFIEAIFKYDRVHFMFVGLDIKEEYYQLKYEATRIVLIWDSKTETILKLKNFNEYHIDAPYDRDQVELVDDAYSLPIIFPVLEMFEINPTTYKLQEHTYIKRKGYKP